MSDIMIPVIGSRGSYELSPPFNTEASSGVQFTCQGLRHFSDYLAANEDVKSLIYTKYNLTDDQYKQDMLANVLIASLQSSTGHWVYVPVQYILNMPNVNGITYRAMSIVVALPSMPATISLDSVVADIKDYVKASLGVDCAIKAVEMSKPVLVSSDIHDQTETERNLLKTGGGTLTEINMQLQNQVQSMTAKIAELEAYILAHQPAA